MKAFLVTAVIAVLFIVTMAFGARNNQLVEVNYFIAQGEFALSWIVGAMFLAGFTISWLMAFAIIVRQKVTIRGMKARLAKQTSETTS
ncbi:LapA family protein [Ferrimonas lipolytica]|uniref:Probable lipopolysaccharide assembly protein A n=1 Tax=Ferrimonas lipolytica TaxID=2724191 RepID=A0A6H1UCN9_9GAMM|nr:lipopolysaccharide assembly protein LapA domain-containing protein [Ferrimonas lipolytica]QIZ76608.1 LapA family protein [Ferrimonas lipolytica]